MNINTLLDWGTKNMQHGEVDTMKEGIRPIPKDLVQALLQTDADKMKKCVQMYINPSSTLAQKQAALDLILLFVETRENAVDLHHTTINGFLPILEDLKSERPSIRLRCAWITGTILQHNPVSQKYFMEQNGQNRLLDALRWELDPQNKGDLDVVGKIVLALSALIENNPSALKELYQSGLFSVVMKILDLTPDDIAKFEENAKAEDAFLKQELQKKNEESSIATEEPNSKQNDDRIVPESSIAAHIQVEDFDSTLKLKTQEIVQDAADTEREPQSKLWTRAFQKTIFFFRKVMVESDTFKLALAKEGDGEFFKKCAAFLRAHPTEYDLIDKTLNAIDLMLQAPDRIQQYIHDAAKKSPELKECIAHLKSIIGKQMNQGGEEFPFPEILRLCFDIESRL
eukprot:TRINITY_DN10756_c0_g1_i2.p1 TRINITY_DN10756_c0_g1~~TRINITY_DN10756_c0_g1_i2.p1  ORF type:complete len:399 (+),score=115.32 TRINITY_DN10756_c0_g1_i2:39-1235(+)